MDKEDRKAAIRVRIDEQIEAIAKAICEGRLPVADQRILRALVTQLAREEMLSKSDP
ncbi:hypothetical protein [Bradyrhizobium sp. Gha]|uniref:hypothetical protein n=1 Tax=Bradyrhizobium sp. Gha TaxID=1855318 RepID=UPI0008EC753D|nr:hypothetical protein [Bradyrhizobium sp. Gha]SFK00965.1 hypothetical protein SAMN05216525_14758 [Bradyrhizobium sp. Gha]